MVQLALHPAVVQAWTVSCHPAQLYAGSQVITAMVLA
jgi:hypothetical protein